MARLYWGGVGTGKTLCLVDDCVNDICSSLMRLQDSYDKVDYYNSLGFSFSKKYEHLSFSNIDINTTNSALPCFWSYKVNPYRLGMPNKNFNTDVFPWGSNFYITEFQNYVDSVMYEYLRPETKQYYQTRRQMGVNFIVDAQRPIDIAKRIRDLIEEFVECLSCEEVVQNGQIVGHIVKQRIIRGSRVLEHYLKTNDKSLCEEYTRVISNCRYGNYDSYFCEMLHLKGREKQDYKVVHFGEEDDSDILTIPLGYYQPKRVNASEIDEVLFYD